MRYNPALDGLRAIAVVMVVAFHTNVPFVRGGMIGVDIFFVISGYLITGILRSELVKTGSIDLRDFYARRLWRLMPALVLAMAGTYLFYRIVRPYTNINGDIIASLLYYADYRIALAHFPTTIKHTWSLAVEMQFYLVWPLFLLATRHMDDRALLRLLLVLFAAATIWRCLNVMALSDWNRSYYSFDTRLSGLLLGAALAVSGWQQRTSATTADRIGAGALLLLTILCISLQWKYTPSLTTGVLLAELAALALIMGLWVERSIAAKALSAPWLVYVGKLSYAIYLWHYGLAVVLRHELTPALSFPITLVAATALSALSFHYVETPCLAWSRRRKTDRDGADKAVISPP